MQSDWNRIAERLTAFWKNELLDRCCLSVTAPLTGRFDMEPLPPRQEDRLLYWTDGERILKRYRKWFASTYFAGDAFPLIPLNLGAAGHAGFYRGTRFYLDDSVWFEPNIREWETDAPVFDPGAFLYRKTLELADVLTAESRGEFLVSMPDVSGNLDALAHLRGSEQLLVDMMAEPEPVQAAAKQVEALWESTLAEVYRITRRNGQTGSCIGWLGTWAPGLHAQSQCDLSAMISPEMYRTFYLGELTAQSGFLEYPLYHFDGVEQIRHLDAILSVDSLKVVQWTSVAGQPSPLAYVEALRRIQRAGKGLHLSLSPNEVESALTSLSSKGLFLQVHAGSPDEADAVVRIAKRFSRE